jgi:hypothetical protein
MQRATFGGGVVVASVLFLAVALASALAVARS